MIKSADVDKGGGGKTLIHKMWIKNMFVFLNPSLRNDDSSVSGRLSKSEFCYGTMKMNNINLIWNVGE